MQNMTVASQKFTKKGYNKFPEISQLTALVERLFRDSVHVQVWWTKKPHHKFFRKDLSKTLAKNRQMGVGPPFRGAAIFSHFQPGAVLALARWGRATGGPQFQLGGPGATICS